MKNEKKLNKNNKLFLTFNFLHGKIYIWLRNIFGKT